MALKVAYGTYVGDGNDNRDISVSPSFVIKAVMIKNNSTNGAQLSFAGMGDKARNLAVETAAPGANVIQSIGTGTFQVGASSGTNGNGITYYWFALGGDDTEIVANTFTGDGTDDRQITTSFLPELVIMIDETSDLCYSRFGAIAGDQSLSFAGAGGLTGADNIQSFNSTGFVVGGSANNNGLVYRYLAIKAVSGQTYTGNYTGNDGDDRNITAPNFQPVVVFLKGTGEGGVFRTASHSGDTSSRFLGMANADNWIQSFISTGFQIGGDDAVNHSTSTYYYYAIKEGSINYTLPISVGTLGLTGIAALFHLGWHILTSVGAFALTGIDALFASGKGMAASVGTFVLTGVDASLRSTRSMATSVGVFVLTGIDATFSVIKVYLLTAGTAVFTLVGNPVRLLLNGLAENWANQTKKVSTWINQIKQ